MKRLPALFCAALLAAGVSSFPWATEGTAPPAPRPAAGLHKFRLAAVPPAAKGGKVSEGDAKFNALAQEFNGELDKAREAAKKADNPELLRQGAKEASRKFEALAKREDLSPAAGNQLGALYNQTEDYGAAKAVSERVLSRAPDDRDALGNRAAAHYGLGDYREAIADATRLTQVDPSNESAYTTRALAHYQARDYLQAAEDARRALALNKNNDVALATLRLAESRVKRPELKLDAAQLAQAERIKEEYQVMQQQRNQAEAESRKPEPAYASTSRGGETLARQASAKIAMQDHWGAVEDATKALAVNPRNAQAYYLRATAYNLVGEREKAVEDADAALRLMPGHSLALDARAAANLELGKFAEAVDDSSQSLALSPRNAYAYATRARAHEKLGRLPEMLADYQQAARLSPQFEAAYRDAAAAHALPAPAAPLSAMRPLAPSAPAGAAASSRPKSLLLVTISSLVGGLLIAIGLLHILSAQWNRKLTTAIRRLEEVRAATQPGQASSSLGTNFQIVRTLGQGGMGVVYEGVDKALNRRVAIKKMRDEIKLNPRERERFLQEARTVGALHHPAIVDIHAIVEDAGELYLVFEYVSGRTVEDLLEERRRLTPAEVKRILRGVCQALDYAHRHGVVHRDLKPSNIMLDEDGQVKVMDFGIARQAKDSLSQFSVTNTVIGTPLYMAPEAEKGVVRKEADLYALGACLYEMLTGNRPFPAPATTSAKLAMDYPKPSRLRGELPAAVDALVDAALQPDPDKRLADPLLFLSKLDAALPG